MDKTIIDLDIGNEIDWVPSYLAESAWLEHIPFAFWLMKTLKPRLLVELGTHWGVSYSAFCQSIEQLQLDSRSFAVDTWAGDEHAGYYGEEVFSSINILNQTHWRRFSSLLRMSFAEARQYFSDGEIDLLHIDGLHTYEAASDDFMLWKKTLSQYGVVLFHDINVRERGFGIWRLWQDLKNDYPHFEFSHGHGLGVLGVGQEFSAPLKTLFAASSCSVQAAKIRNLFAARGEGVQLRWDFRRVGLHLQKIEEEKNISNLTVRQLKEKAEILQSNFDAEINCLSKDLREARDNIAKDQIKISKMVESLEHQKLSLKINNDELESKNEKIKILEQEKEYFQQKFQEIIKSNSWKITKPLRITKALIALEPAYVNAIGKLKVIKFFFKSLTKIFTPPKNIQNNINLIRYLLQRHGGLVPLVQRGAKIICKHGVAGFLVKWRSLERVSDISSLQTDNEVSLAKNIFNYQQSEISHNESLRAIDGFSVKPLISVIMPVYNTPLQWLRCAIESLQKQYYNNWELCVVDDASPTDAQRKLLWQIAKSDSRVRVKVMSHNVGIASASNAAVAMAQGQYIALLDHDDELTPDAIFRVVEAINQKPDADFLYSDECKISDTSDRELFEFIFKPDWSPEFMFNAMLTGHLTVYRKDLIESVGLFRTDYDFSQDYDLALRASEAARCIVHIERVLYLWRAIPGSAARGGKDFARETNVAALSDALQRRGIAGDVMALPHANYVQVTLPSALPLVSLIIPSDSADNLRIVLNSIRKETGYVNYEVIVVCNGPLADRLSAEFCDWSLVYFVKYDKKYNFSDKCNEGALASHGEIVVFYNDDVFPLQRDWIEHLIEYLWVPGVGGVSPKLLHENDTIQYAGMISGTPGLCGTAYNNIPNNVSDKFLTMHNYVRNVSILSGACCALWKNVFLEIGAFDAINTPDGHSDMDLSYKLMEAGYRCVYTPYALLRHIGNHSWAAKPYKYKADIYALKRWGKFVSKDPYFTTSMKQVLYNDFRFDYRIYADHLDPKKHYTGLDVLFVSHQLSLTGAPMMLFYAACIVRKSGGFPVVVSPTDGPLRDMLVNAGIAVIIDESIDHNHFLFENFARNFDLAIINTVSLNKAVSQLSRIPILKTIWWLHEAESLTDCLDRDMGIVWEKVSLYCVSNYAKQFLPNKLTAKILRNGIPDESAQLRTVAEDKPVTFLIAGTIEFRKGQDIFVDAIALLPKHVRAKCRFVIVGKLWKPWQKYWEKIEKKIEFFPEIEYVGSLEHSPLLHMISTADVLVCCSRDDPAPLVVVEAAMLSKPSILNERIGSAEVLDAQSCFMFECGNVQSLAEQILAAYRQRAHLPDMGLAARLLFEKEWTIEAFEKRFWAAISEEIRAKTHIDSIETA